MKKHVTFMYVQIKQLKIWPAYQRSLNVRHVKRMAEKFDVSICGALTCCRRGGQIYVLDGQHRMRAAEAAGLTVIPCVFVEAPDVKTEAKIFFDTNTVSVGVNRLDSFRAQCAAGDADALRVRHALASHGLELSRKGDEACRNPICFLHLQKKYGDDYVSKLLDFTEKAWKDSKRRLTEGVLGGLVIFSNALAADKNIGLSLNDPEVVETFSRHGFDALWVRAKGLQAANTGTLKKCFALAMRDFWNKGRRKTQLTYE